MLAFYSNLSCCFFFFCLAIFGCATFLNFPFWSRRLEPIKVGNSHCNPNISIFSGWTSGIKLAR